ncbi:MAG: hypothetical protein QM628_15560 [Propionicimonas sp.]
MVAGPKNTRKDTNHEARTPSQHLEDTMKTRPVRRIAGILATALVVALTAPTAWADDTDPGEPTDPPAVVVAEPAPAAVGEPAQEPQPEPLVEDAPPAAAGDTDDPAPGLLDETPAPHQQPPETLEASAPADSDTPAELPPVTIDTGEVTLTVLLGDADDCQVPVASVPASATFAFEWSEDGGRTWRSVGEFAAGDTRALLLNSAEPGTRIVVRDAGLPAIQGFDWLPTVWHGAVYVTVPDGEMYTTFYGRGGASWEVEANSRVTLQALLCATPAAVDPVPPVDPEPEPVDPEPEPSEPGTDPTPERPAHRQPPVNPQAEAPADHTRIDGGVPAATTSPALAAGGIVLLAAAALTARHLTNRRQRQGDNDTHDRVTSP